MRSRTSSRRRLGSDRRKRHGEDRRFRRNAGSTRSTTAPRGGSDLGDRQSPAARPIRDRDTVTRRSGGGGPRRAGDAVSALPLTWLETSARFRMRAAWVTLLLGTSDESEGCLSANASGARPMQKSPSGPRCTTAHRSICLGLDRRRERAPTRRAPRFARDRRPGVMLLSDPAGAARRGA